MVEPPVTMVVVPGAAVVGVEPGPVVVPAVLEGGAAGCEGTWPANHWMLPPAEVGNEAELVSVEPAVTATVRPESGQEQGSP